MRVVLPLIHRHRHPLLHAVSLVLGLLVVGVLMVFGMVVAGVLMMGGAFWLAWRQWRHGRASTNNKPAAAGQARQPEVLEGEYVVIRHSRPVTR